VAGTHSNRGRGTKIHTNTSQSNSRTYHIKNPKFTQNFRFTKSKHKRRWRNLKNIHELEIFSSNISFHHNNNRIHITSSNPVIIIPSINVTSTYTINFGHNTTSFHKTKNPQPQPISDISELNKSTTTISRAKSKFISPTTSSNHHSCVIQTGSTTISIKVEEGEKSWSFLFFKLCFLRFNSCNTSCACDFRVSIY